MSFRGRIDSALAHELAVMEKLRFLGWTAEPFGQGQLTDGFRAALWRADRKALFPSRIRWMPDIITYCEFNDGNSPGARTKLRLVDAKTTLGDKPNYSIEIASLETSIVFSSMLNTHCVFVTGDFKVLTPQRVKGLGSRGPAPRYGSGTPYVLVKKAHGEPFEKWFPPGPDACANDWDDERGTVISEVQRL